MTFARQLSNTFGASSFSLQATALNFNRANISFIALTTAWLVTFLPILQALISNINSLGVYNKYSYISLFILAFIVKHKNRLKNIDLHSSQIGLLSLLGLAVLWVVAHFKYSGLIEQLIILSMLPIIFSICYGSVYFKSLLFAWLFVYFWLPVGLEFAIILKNFCCNNLIKLFAWSNLPIYWESKTIIVKDNFFNLLDIVKPLDFSGYFLLIGAFLGYEHSNKILQQLKIVACFLLLPYIALFIGIFGAFSLEIWFNFWEINNINFTVLSWSFISFGLILAFIINLPYKHNVTYLYSNNTMQWGSNNLNKNKRWFTPIILSIGIFITATYFTSNFEATIKSVKLVANFKLPNNLEKWQGPYPVLAEMWQPKVLANTATVLGEYRHQIEMADVQVFVASFNSMLELKQLLANDFLYDSNSWQLIHNKKNYAKHQNKLLKNSQEIILSNGSVHRLIWFWHIIDEVPIASRSLFNILGMVQSMLYSESNVKFIAIASDFTNDLHSARQNLESFLNEFKPHMEFFNKTELMVYLQK